MLYGYSMKAKAMVALHQGAAKRLIARGVAALPQVRRALREGLVAVTLGTTNAYVAEELLGKSVDKVVHCAGYIGRELSVVPAERRGRELVLEKGRLVDLSPEEIAGRLSAGDVVIKGGNVLDPQGVAKSALITRLSRAPRRLGVARPHRRELPAGLAYTGTISIPEHARHVVAWNLAFARALGGTVPEAPAAPDGRWLLGPEPAPRDARLAVLLPGAPVGGYRLPPA